MGHLRHIALYFLIRASIASAGYGRIKVWLQTEKAREGAGPLLEECLLLWVGKSFTLTFLGLQQRMEAWVALYLND